jgi:hypothetical protein
MFEGDFLDFPPISWGHIVGVGFFEIEIFAIEPVFTLFLALATVDMSRLIAFIRVEKYAPAQNQKNCGHFCIVFLLRLDIMTSEQREVDPRGDAGELTRNQSRLMAHHHLQPRRSTMAQSSTLCIGMDVHQETIAVADVAHDHGAEVTYLGTMGTRQCDLDQLVRQMPSKATPLGFVDEAGPCGSWL